MLYHYTDRLSAADIRRDGVIRATPITLHRDMFARDKGLETPPLVWLTVNPILDGTVITKMLVTGRPKSLIGDLWRFCVRNDYHCQSLGEYIDASGVDPAWWEWTVRTGSMAGSDYMTWRLCLADIPAADWLAIEVLDDFNSTGTQWKAAE